VHVWNAHQSVSGRQIFGKIELDEKNRNVTSNFTAHYHFRQNTEIWKAEGKAMDTNMGKSPGYRSQTQLPGNSPSEEVRGHWKLTGAEHMEQWMSG